MFSEQRLVMLCDVDTIQDEETGDRKKVVVHAHKWYYVSTWMYIEILLTTLDFLLFAKKYRFFVDWRFVGLFIIPYWC